MVCQGMWRAGGLRSPSLVLCQPIRDPNRKPQCCWPRNKYKDWGSWPPEAIGWGRVGCERTTCNSPTMVGVGSAVHGKGSIRERVGTWRSWESPVQPTSWGLGLQESALPHPAPLRAAWLRLRGLGSDVGLASRTHRPEPAYIRWGLPPPLPLRPGHCLALPGSSLSKRFPDVLSSS